MREVLEGITEAYLIWADLTGGNANVFYELGIAHALKKRTVLLSQRREDVPFDLRGYKNYVYALEFESAPSFVDSMSREMAPFLTAALKGELKFGNPYTDFGAQEDGEAESAGEEGRRNPGPDAGVPAESRGVHRRSCCRGSNQ